jgi:hypothetical protein
MALVRKLPGSMIVIYLGTQARDRETGGRQRTLMFQDGCSSMLMASVTPSNAGVSVSKRDLISEQRGLTMFRRGIEPRSSHWLEAD